MVYVLIVLMPRAMVIMRQQSLFLVDFCAPALNVGVPVPVPMSVRSVMAVVVMVVEMVAVSPPYLCWRFTLRVLSGIQQDDRRDLLASSAVRGMRLPGLMAVVSASEYTVVSPCFRSRDDFHVPFRSLQFGRGVQSDRLCAAVGSLARVSWECDDGFTFVLRANDVVCAVRHRT